MNPLTPDEYAEELRDAIHRINAQVSQLGWTAKLRWEDNRPGEKLLGFRLTAAQKLFDDAVSIQIFDRETVTLSYGFTNDDHVTLTKDDGREFLEWLRALPNGPLVPAIWMALEKPAEPPQRAGVASAVTNLAKARLVEYLVENYPEVFGRFGSQSVEKSDFYDEVLALVKDPARDTAVHRQAIQALETMAHEFYAIANRQAAASSASANAKDDWLVTFGPWLEALGYIRAAERCRHQANERRARLTTDAPAETDFPDAITAEDLPQIFPDPSTPHPPKSYRQETETLAVVIEENHPRHGQMCDIVRPGPELDQVYVRFTQDRELILMHRRSLQSIDPFARTS